MDRITSLFEKYKNNQCSSEELEELLAYFSLTGNEKLLKDNIDKVLLQEGMSDAELERETQEVYAQLQTKLTKRNSPLTILSLKWAAAAAVIIIFGLGSYLFIHQSNRAPQTAQHRVKDIAPGSNKAVLTLANGKKISLTDAGEGRLAQQNNVAINKAKNGELSYDISTGNLSSVIRWDTLTIPRGGQYKLILADGTKVWLNAGTAMRYPEVFSNNNRSIELLYGEAYFEVVHNAAAPFRVLMKEQVVEDLGTHFNINAYADEPDVTTTLLEGKVKVSKGAQSQIINPGQQSITRQTSNDITVGIGNAESAISWKEGHFHFQSADVQTVMRQLSRWYDVDVTYNGTIPARTISGDIDRNATLSTALKIIGLLNIHYQVEGRTITITP